MDADAAVVKTHVCHELVHQLLLAADFENLTLFARDHYDI